MSTRTTSSALPMPEPAAAGRPGDPFGRDRRALLAQRLRERALRPAPLAPHQERLVVLQELAPESTAYSVSLVLRLDGDLDRQALRAALSRLPERHPWLRSRVERRGEQVVQVIDPQADVDLQELRDVPDAAAGAGRGRAVQEWVQELLGTPFDLGTAPLWRAGIARPAEDTHLLVLVVHHVACDATSMDVLLDDLGAHYDAARAGEVAELPRPPSPQDLAEHLRRLAADAPPVVADRLDALEGTVPDARLPQEAYGQSGEPGPAAAEELAVDPDVSARLRAAAHDLAVTPFALVGAAVAAVTSRFTGLDSAVLGVPVDLRWQVPGSESVVAFLVETAAVGVHDVLDHSLASAAGAVRDRVVEALGRPVPFADVVEGLRSRGRLPATGTPLHTYLTWLDEDGDLRLGTTGPQMTPLDPPLGRAKFDLAFTGSSGPCGAALHLEYDAGRIQTATARRLLEHVQHLLDVGTRHPHVPLRELPLLPPHEEHAIRAFEGSPGAEPDRDLVRELLAGLDLAHPAAPVLLPSVRATGEVVTPAVLRDRVDALAATLRAAGVRPGDAVVVSGHRCAGAVVAMLAVLRAGGAFVPADVAAPLQRRETIARTVRARAVVGEAAWARELAGRVGVRAVAVDEDGRPAEPGPPPTAWEPRRPGDVAYVLFTSGSTGTPKGVTVTDAAVVSRIDSYRQVLADRDVVLLAHSPLGFDASIWMLWALAVGGRLVVPADAEAGDPVALVRLVAAGRVTDSFFVPSLYEPVLQAGDPASLASLRRVFVGGETFPPALADLHVATAPGAALLNVYGPTETVVTATAHRVANPRRPGPVPIGRPHPGTAAAVLDRHGLRVPLGAPGELHIGGPAVALGYAGRLDDPDGPFRTRPADGGRPVRWYATGDVVRWSPDGDLLFVGRRDRQVKVSGQRVELAEVEAGLRRCRGVADVAVEPVGQGADRYLVGVVAPDVPTDLVEQARCLLPAAWVPSAWVGVPALPRGSSGKLDRAGLLALVEQADAVSGRGVGPEPDPEDLRFTERALLSLVRALLQADDVRLDDDFFAVGGNSLLAARLAGTVAARLGVDIPLALLAADARLRRIVELVETGQAITLAESHDEVRLLPLRAVGTEAPLVVVARDGDSSLFLRHLLPTLAPHRSVWVLLRPMPPLGPQVPDLAGSGRAAARALRERFPSGPVHLVGHSTSGIVALETARALGERRGAVVLLDAVAPSGGGPLRDVLDRLEQARLRLYLRRRRGVRLGRLTAEQQADPAVIRSVRWYQEARAIDQARPLRSSFPVAVVAAEQTRAEVGDDLGWQRWCSDLRVLPVAGDHHSMLLDPVADATVAALDTVLRDLP